MARELREGIRALEPATSAALGILALASGIYTYIGVKSLLDGSSAFSNFAAFAYSSAVSVAIYVFWSYILKFLPLLKTGDSKLKMVAAMFIGSAAIVAMSSWLNAAALAGSAAVEQHLAVTVEKYQAALEQTQENALAAQGLLPDIRIAAKRFGELAKKERTEGALTGTSGSGTVVQALGQMAGELESIEKQIVDSRAAVESLYTQAGQHLKRMRELVAGQGAVAKRSIEFAEESVQIAGLIAELKQTSVAPAVKRVALDLGRAFVPPAPDARSASVRAAQSMVVENVRLAITSQSAALTTAADQVLEAPAVLAPRFTPISTAEAVLVYWDSFIPSWAGAVSIDLLPAVIVLILWAVMGAIRSHEDPLPSDSSMTLRDMEAALDALHRIELKRALIRDSENPDGAEDEVDPSK
ncbi:MAG: hypothetical protein GKR94_23450 [Gammaproteobacteria bacterium]|nr:hypothetical protein [Gammaproteobacteria bacterium]